MAHGWELRGKTAVVTGGARRIGRAIALALGSAGAHVAIHYNRSADDANAVLAELRAYGVQAWALGADLGNPVEAEGLFARIVEAAGPVDMLINNASVFPRGTLDEVTALDLLENVNLHAYAPLALARHMAAQGREGAIVNLLDARVQDYDHEHVAYHLSKRMLLSLTSILALELAPRIRVNGVAPGLILPPAGQGQDYLEGLASTNPLNAYGAAEDIAAAVVFLLESRFITGQVIYVDGGRHLRGRVYG